MKSLYSNKDTATTDKVLFIDCDHCLTSEMKNKLLAGVANKEVIIEKSYPNNVNDVRYIFILIEETKQISIDCLESLLIKRGKEKHTYTLLMTVDSPSKKLLSYFNHNLDGIISLKSFLKGVPHVLKTLDEFGVFLEQNLHSDLIVDIQRKKMKDHPIKQLVLRVEDVENILTRNEKKVLQYILDGHNNRKIAELMFLAPSTVSTVISHLLKKLGANDRTDAMVQIIRRGWVDAVR
ncbi:response regulator transcription factor [Salipaludibacillus sp. HK11]|uniref:response regulator transcription factor n=1 Tax=Salipaludibacillus sp. HK11 TaxID=3394320 RepID=UPI0039FC59ED